MFRQAAAATGATLCCFAIAAAAHSNDLARLPQSQVRMANCMVAVLSDVPEVSEPRLIWTRSGRRAIIAYKYRHKDEHIEPKLSSNRMDITRILAGKERTLVLGGLMPVHVGDDSDAAIQAYLDDSNSGMPRIVEMWRARCGLKLDTLWV